MANIPKRPGNRPEETDQPTIDESNDFYHLVGNPKPTDLAESSGYTQTLIAAGVDDVKVFGGVQALLDIPTDDLRLLTLTCSRENTILTHLTWTPSSQGRNNFPFIEDFPEFYRYVLQNQVDSVIISGMCT